jgi:RhtB (resistance to homoserine/threonine) family protein
MTGFLATIGVHDFWLFVLAGLALNVTPGPDTFYIVGRSVAQGRRAGVISALGIGTGCLVHMTASALGLSLVMARIPTAFIVIRGAGAVYLIYLGARMLFPQSDAAETIAKQPASSSTRRTYVQAMLTNILNPKVVLFFLAFLPQFVTATTSHRTVALLFLGFVFVVNGTLWCFVLAWFAAGLSQGLRQSKTAARWLERGAGALFIALGLRVARG